MANIKHFSDIGGVATLLKGSYGMDNKEFALRFPGVKGLRCDGYTMWVGYPLEGTGGQMPVTRKIEYKAFPSRHECNAKCMGGKINGTCECQCGGRNHGAGMFTQLLRVAA